MNISFRRSAALLALLTAPLLARPVLAATLLVGEHQEYKTLSAAVAKLSDGDTIKIDPGEYFDCASIAANNVNIIGAGMDKTVFTDKTCGGKAILITTGQHITISDLTLQRARVADFNGAGIRGEGQSLTVERVHFDNNQNGILMGTWPGATMLIKDSLFTKNGTCEASCGHGIYVGGIDKLTVEHSKFFETREGHSIKSRAKATEVIDCDIEDGPNGTSSYQIDIPNGGSLIARGNTIEKGPKSQNHTAAIMIGEEGITQRTPQIIVENNTMTQHGDYSTLLIKNFTATEAQLKNNKLTGHIKALMGDGTVD